MKGFNIEFSFEKKVDAFASKNYDKLVTVKEDLFWFGRPEDILDFNTSADEILVGIYSLLKKHINTSTKDAQFHILGYEFDRESCMNQKSLFRYSMYISWGKIDRMYIKLNGDRDQLEYSQYDDNTKDFIPNLSMQKTIKKELYNFIHQWFAVNGSAN